MTIISGTINSGVTLRAQDGAYNPVLVTGVINVATEYATALYGYRSNGVGPTPWTITNQGVIQATGVSSRGIVLGAGGAVDNSGLIQGAFRGISAYGYSANVTNTGTILGTAGIGSGEAAVALLAGGNVVNGTAGSNAALIQGTNDGVAGVNNLINYGTIIGTAAFGVDGGAGGSIINATGALITGGSGIRNGATLVNNAGIISGTAGYALRLFGEGAALVNNTGIIQGSAAPTVGAAGIQFDTFNPDGTVINGTSLTTNALVSGTDGISLQGNGTVVNYGSIVGTSYNGIFVGGSGSVTNGSAAATGRIIVSQGNGVYFGGGYSVATVTNFGTIAAFNAVFFNGNGTVFNSSTGLIDGSNDGIGGVSNLTNYGTIIGDVSFGVDGGGGGAITNGAGAVITGANGIRNGATLVNNAGVISGTAGYALRLFGPGPVAVNNIGVIQGSGVQSAVGISLEVDGTVVNGTGLANTALISGVEGVVLQGTGSVVNYGTIVGTDASGVFLSNGAVSNFNRIAGSDRGVFIAGVGTVANLGTVSASNPNYGFGVQLGGGGTVINGSAQASGALIRGAFGVAMGGAGTVINYGTIGRVGGNLSVLFSGADDRLVVAPGAVFLAQVQANDGNDTLQLIGGAGPGTLLSLGSAFAGFETVVIDPGAAWRISMFVAPPAFTGTISGFSSDDSLDLTDLEFDPSGTAVLGPNNVLQINAGGTSVSIALDPLQNFSGATFLLSSNGSDGTLVTMVPGATAPRDFGGDARSDILWRHDSGTVYIWQMDGLVPIASGAAGSADASWQVRGTGDFNGDRMEDILWQHDSGVVYIWQMNGTQLVATGAAGSADASWHILATADFNGDNKADILWRHDSGTVYIWEMDGFAPVSSGQVGAADADWHVRGTADFNGDDKSDILWQHASGSVYIWLMDGTTPIGSGEVGSADASWHIRGTGDFNADGNGDILWQHDSGAVYIWLMNGTSPVASGTVGSADASWHIRGLGEFNGDGASDILWQHDSGAVYIWLMNGFTPIGSGQAGSADAAWHIVPPDNTGAIAPSLSPAAAPMAVAPTAAAPAETSFGFADISGAGGSPAPAATGTAASLYGDGDTLLVPADDTGLLLDPAALYHPYWSS